MLEVEVDGGVEMRMSLEIGAALAMAGPQDRSQADQFSGSSEAEKESGTMAQSSRQGQTREPTWYGS